MRFRVWGYIWIEQVIQGSYTVSMGLDRRGVLPENAESSGKQAENAATTGISGIFGMPMGECQMVLLGSW